MTTFKYDDWAQLTPEIMTSLYLYGTPMPPSNLMDRVGNPNRNISVVLNAANFMSSGPGSYANPANIQFIRTLFSGQASLQA